MSVSLLERRLVRIAALVGTLLCLYTLLGFFAAPALLRHAIEEKGAAALHREVRVAKVRVNPLALSVRIEGLEIRDRSGAPFAAWDSLYVRAAPWRLVAGDVGIAEIHLVRPSLHGGLHADGSPSFADLLSQEAPPGVAAADEKPSRLGVYIGRLAVDGARISFRDATRHPAFESTLGPLTFRLDALRTKGGRDSPYSLTGTTESGEAFRWTGTIRARPLRSAGTLAFERIKLAKYAPYLREEAPVSLRDGLVDLETRYELEWSAVRHLLRTSGGKLIVSQLALGPLEAVDAPVRLSRVEVTGIAVDPLARDAKVSAVEVRGGTIRARRDSDGLLDLARMAPPPSPGAASPGWSWSVDSLAISQLAVQIEDRVPKQPVVLSLGDVALRASGLRPGRAVSCPVEASATWASRGRIALKGSVQPFAARGILDVDVADLDLLPLEPYLRSATTARLTGGRASVKAKVGFDASGSTARWSLIGDLRLDAVSVAERDNEDLLRWRAVEVTGIDATAVPARATVRLVRVVEPRLKAYVWEDGTTSVARARATPPAPIPADGRPAAPAPEWRAAIGAVQVVRGRLAFVDRTVRPPAVVNLTGADAKVTDLSSDPNVRSTVDARFDVEGASPIRITGTLNPLQKTAYTRLAIASQGVDLSPLDPYAGKFLGYGIRKGKLDLDLHYEIEQRRLAAKNVVKVDQFTLGDATRIPVRLALALLQDRDGVILLDVPVEGDLDDPDFHVGKVIWRAILNVLVKVATSPFSALASLVGGSHADLSVAEFSPGLAVPTPAAHESFALLARSLAQRPAVGLELEGSADPARDGPALRRTFLERTLRQAKAAAMRPLPSSVDDLPLGPDERERLVRRAYDGKFAKPPASVKAGDAAPAPTTAEMEDRLAAALEIPPEAYRVLAAERARRAREALVAAGIDQGRLFLVEGGQRERAAKGACVYFTVR
jgi:hypothetical protein